MCIRDRIKSAHIEIVIYKIKRTTEPKLADWTLRTTKGQQTTKGIDDWKPTEENKRAETVVKTGMKSRPLLAVEPPKFSSLLIFPSYEPPCQSCSDLCSFIGHRLYLFPVCGMWALYPKSHPGRPTSQPPWYE